MCFDAYRIHKKLTWYNNIFISFIEKHFWIWGTLTRSFATHFKLRHIELFLANLKWPIYWWLLQQEISKILEPISSWPKYLISLSKFLSYYDCINFDLSVKWLFHKRKLTLHTNKTEDNAIIQAILKANARKMRLPSATTSCKSGIEIWGFLGLLRRNVARSMLLGARSHFKKVSNLSSFLNWRNPRFFIIQKKLFKLQKLWRSACAISVLLKTTIEMWTFQIFWKSPSKKVH